MAKLAGMKLYSGGRAPNPRRVRMFLAQKDIEIETVEIDIGKLEQRTPGFARINPMRTLPVLILEDGTAISETVAICRYLESLVPKPPLLGVNAKDTAIVEMWQRRIELGFFLPVGFAFRHLHPGAANLESPQIAAWGEANQVRARAFMEFLDSELANRPFMAGKRFTIADITAIAAYQFLRAARIPVPDDLKHLTRWYGEVLEYPGVNLKA